MPDRPEPVVVLADQDYRFGVGPLILRIEQIDQANPIPYDGEDWITVHGTELRHDGTELGRRAVLVRSTRLAVQVPQSLSRRANSTIPPGPNRRPFGSSDRPRSTSS